MLTPQSMTWTASAAIKRPGQEMFKMQRKTMTILPRRRTTRPAPEQTAVNNICSRIKIWPSNLYQQLQKRGRRESLERRKLGPAPARHSHLRPESPYAIFFLTTSILRVRKPSIGTRILIAQSTKRSVS